MKRTILRIGWSLTRFGERHGIRILTYNPITWASFYISGRREGAIFARIISELKPEIHSALDVGAGTGGYVAALARMGVRSIGVEYSWIGRILGKLQGSPMLSFDCSRKEACPELGRFDLVFSIEVGEHLPNELSSEFVEYISRHGDLVVFSSAFPGQGGHGHINEQPKDFWRELFNKCGFNNDVEMELLISTRLEESGYRGWLPKNLQVFRRNDVAI
jgi:SAM-dependent methyltransferase